MTDKDEQEALAWLDGHQHLYGGLAAERRHIGTIRRRLARPVLPMALSDALVERIRRAVAQEGYTGCTGILIGAVGRALYAELTRPKVKTVYRISWGTEDEYVEYPTFGVAIDAIRAFRPGLTCTIKPVEIPDA